MGYDMSLGFITINGRSSLEWGVHTSDAGIYDRPEREMETVSVPGRSGDLLIDHDRYKNIDVRYPAFIVDDFDHLYMEFFSFLLSQGRYVRLEDSFRPEEYRQGYFSNPVSPIRTDREKGTFEIIAHCKPQRYLKEGEKTISVINSASVVDAVIKNPTYLPALPLVRVYGTGSVTIGDTMITILSADGYTDIDCESQIAYKGSTNCNANIQLNTGSFWKLQGESNVSLGSRIDSIAITPRWYII